jgi:hypothetical protein
MEAFAGAQIPSCTSDGTRCSPHEFAKTFIHRCRSPEAHNLAIEPVDLRGAHVPSVEFTLVPSVAGVPRRFNAAAI